ncbi:acetyltransferase [Dyadobacter arcticus]|uniref:Sugar O-acyltransferase (Sialic acid O-acetyltransferase NeuD family) n=1 Tax=Dyadobacter arcticus TaxID=1078754 RepID=A0ABX0UDL8_9BACT|nr:acetyltransferase [Dyadobacter arcticus]NIJ51098.1 sugar O-acyltransferase (sialic acid O-acetyltransferase NeuD family) [Dyadobacter arcticus]
MILFGAGGHAKVVFSILHACRETVKAIFDDDISKKGQQGFHESIPYDPSILSEELIIIAIGDNLARCQVSEKINHRFGNAIHPSSHIDSSVRMNAGIVIMHAAIVHAGSTIGSHVIINTGAIVEHDCGLGDFVHIAPGAIICGSVWIGEKTLIGAGTIILPNIRIGKNCIIGAGSVVTKDIPDNVTVCGNPARLIKF